MPHRYGLRLALTLFVVICVGYLGYMAFAGIVGGLPFGVRIIDPQTLVIEPLAGRSLPGELRAGDRIDLAASPRATRIALAVTHFSDFYVPPGHTYALALRRDRGLVMVPVTSVKRINPDPGAARLDAWMLLSDPILLGVIGLIALWRGRDRAAAGMTLWALTFLAGLVSGFGSAQNDGMAGLGIALIGTGFYLLARCGFYLMIEGMVEPVLTRGSRRFWRAGFLALLAFGAAPRLAGSVFLVAFGWAGLLQFPDGLVFSISYLVPLALLVFSYGRADVTRRLRLRWMLWAGSVFILSIFLYNSGWLGDPDSGIATDFLMLLSFSGFVYAVLRHRVIDINFVLNRALVYALTMSLVMGLFALLESVIERTTLGYGASLLLELGVPLGLGVALSTMHRRIDGLVERLFFRRQYRAASALGEFARDCAFITRRERLLDQTVDQIMTHTAALGMAVYEVTAAGAARVRQQGAQTFPEQVDLDDPALVRLRSRNAELALHDGRSRLGQEGYVFPMMVRGTLLGAIVLGPRPDERYAPDERELLFHVVHEVGAALLALRARENEQLVERLATGLLSPYQAQQQARLLTAQPEAV